MLETFNTVQEKFSGVEKQFGERDVRVIQAASAQTTAVNAALQAQKEAVTEQNKSFTLSIDKSEKGTGEAIAQQRTLLQTATGSLGDKIDDLKSRFAAVEGQLANLTVQFGRLDGIESRLIGVETRMNSSEGRVRGHGESWQFFVAAIGVVGLLAGAAMAFLRH